MGGEKLMAVENWKEYHIKKYYIKKLFLSRKFQNISKFKGYCFLILAAIWSTFVSIFKMFFSPSELRNFCFVPKLQKCFKLCKMFHDPKRFHNPYQPSVNYEPYWYTPTGGSGLKMEITLSRLIFARINFRVDLFLRFAFSNISRGFIFVDFEYGKCFLAYNS